MARSSAPLAADPASPFVPHQVTEPTITVADIARHLGVPMLGDQALGRVVVRDLVDDSRTISAGDAYLAVPGSRWHGVDFEAQAKLAGAVAVISDRPASTLPTLLVDDPRAVGGELCAWFHGWPSRDIRVFGVTGTNGKSSTSLYLEAGLSAAGEVTGLLSGVAIRGPGVELTPTLTTPEAPLLQRALSRFQRVGVTSCAMEVSSHAVTQGRVDGTRYRTMAFTNLGHDHLDYHGTMENYFRAKASLFTCDWTETAVVCVDDAYGRRLAAATTVPTWTCSTRDPSADVYADGLVCDVSGSRFLARTPVGDVPVHLQTMGPHQVSNAVLALTSLLADGIDLAAAVDGISSVRRIPGRCDPVQAGQSFIAIVDYMHNESGQQALLPYLRSLATGRLILVIGATGGRDPSKRGPLGTTAATFADIVIVTDESPGDEDPAAIRADVVIGAHRARHAEVIEEPDRHRALELAVAAADRDDVVVVAGRGSDQVQRYGLRSLGFDDRTHLELAIAARSRGTPAAVTVPGRADRRGRRNGPESVERA
ncbi:MAG: Mur ligase family protein [Dietzia sp.]